MWGLPEQRSGTESACNAGAARDTGSIPGLERSPGTGMATHFRLVTWKIQWTKELGRLQSPGLQRAGHD